MKPVTDIKQSPKPHLRKLCTHLDLVMGSLTNWFLDTIRSTLGRSKLRLLNYHQMCIIGRTWKNEKVFRSPGPKMYDEFINRQQNRSEVVLNSVSYINNLTMIA